MVEHFIEADTHDVFREEYNQVFDDVWYKVDCSEP